MWLTCTRNTIWFVERAWAKLSVGFAVFRSPLRSLFHHFYPQAAINSQDLDYLPNWIRVNELFFLTWRKENLKICLVPVNGWICQVKLSVSGSLINTITCYKYFGVHLDPSHNFETHFLKKYPKAAGRVNFWRRIRSSIDNLNAQRINQSMIMPIFTY